MKALTFLLLCFASVALADDFKTIDGKEYKNATVSRVEPDGIVLSSKSGISKVYFTELPKEVQERLNYDTAKAAAYSAEQVANGEPSGEGIAVELVVPYYAPEVYYIRCIFNDSSGLGQFQAGNPISLTGTVDGVRSYKTLTIKDCHLR